MVSVWVVFLIVSALLWLVSEIVPMNGWVAKVARMVWVTVATIMLSGIAS